MYILTLPFHCFLQALRFVNFKKSKGNYFVDTDGNVVLDFANPIALGYNHDQLINARDSDLYDRFLQGKVDTSVVPPSDYADILRDNIMPVAPTGHSQVHLSDGSITSANESALATALTHYAIQHKREYSSLSVLGFENGTHGQSVATLSASDPSANHLNVPTYDWPVAPLPNLVYPLAKNETENRAEEDRCLEATRQLINDRKADSKDVAAIIIEPFTALNGRQATPRYYKKLRALAKDNGIPFIVDETRTGVGASGKMWAHEHWYLSEPADLVTFGGRAGISGFYSTLAFRQNSHCTSFEQNVDFVKLLGFGVTWKTIQNKNLLDLVQDSSSFLKIELGNIERDLPGTITNIRGNGTNLAFDAYSPRHADSIQSWLFKSGINVQKAGDVTLALRPSLVLRPKHAANLRDSLSAFSPQHDVDHLH